MAKGGRPRKIKSVRQFEERAEAYFEAPWLNAEGRADNTITTESMRTFFPTLLEETA